MSPHQCLGTTQAGRRCLIKVHSGTFCRHHVHQSPQALPSSHGSYYLPKSRSPAKAPHSPARTPSPLKSAPKTPKQTSPAKLPGSFLERSSPVPSPTAIHKHSPVRQPRTTKVDYTKPGYIYVYTLALLLNNGSKGGWLKTRNLLNEAKHKDKWVDFNSKALLMLLVKVGMTTQTVAKRILQWESKCHHKLVCLHPEYPMPLGKTSLLERFKKLSISSLRSSAQFRQYTTFQDNVKGFFVPRDVMKAEKEIHEALKMRFGRGDVYCTGCVEKAKSTHKESNLLSLLKKKDFVQSDYNVHVEWFPIPKKKLNEVFKTIDLICLRYLP